MQGTAPKPSVSEVSIKDQATVQSSGKTAALQKSTCAESKGIKELKESSGRGSPASSPSEPLSKRKKNPMKIRQIEDDDDDGDEDYTEPGVGAIEDRRDDEDDWDTALAKKPRGGTAGKVTSAVIPKEKNGGRGSVVKASADGEQSGAGRGRGRGRGGGWGGRGFYMEPNAPPPNKGLKVVKDAQESIECSVLFWFQFIITNKLSKMSVEDPDVLRGRWHLRI